MSSLNFHDVLILKEEQRRFETYLYPGAVSIWITGSFLAAATWVLAKGSVYADHALIWIAVYVLIMVATMLARSKLASRDIAIHMRNRWQITVVLSHGLMWALPPLLFFNPQEPRISMFMLCMVAGISAGAVPICGTRPFLYALLTLPMYASQVLVFGTYGLQNSDAFHLLMAAAMLLLGAVNQWFARLTYSTLHESIFLGYENQGLVTRLQQQTVLLSEQTLAAQEASLAKTKFLAAASHDLRQPVHALNLFIEVLRGTKLDPRQRSIVGNIHAASQASRELLNTLLDFSRIEAGVMMNHPEPTNIAAILLSLQEEFGPQADSKNLVYRCRDTQAVAMCDPSLVALVLRNFVSNAIRYTSRGGVLIGVRQRGAEWAVQIWDTGIGIAQQHQQDIFKEFHQLSNPERNQQKGLGLGLAIAQGLAKTMGARITLASAPGRGSVFTLWLPSAEGLGIAKVAPTAVEQIESSDQKIFENLSVLVVDDEDSVRQSMTALLEYWGCQVHAAANIEQAKTLAEDAFPQLLITDYRLSENRHGGEVIAALKKLAPPDCQLDAIIITGDTDPKRIREAASHGATLLHKPVAIDLLRKAMLSFYQRDANKTLAE